MVKYRIKSYQVHVFGSSGGEPVKYKVQCKYKFIPFWFTCTRGFNTLEHAQIHIQLKLGEQYDSRHK